MCNCFEDIAENIKSMKYKHLIKSVAPPKGLSLNSATNNLSTIYILPFFITFEGINKQKEVSIKMNFCPICGQKFNEDTPSV